MSRDAARTGIDPRCTAGSVPEKWPLRRVPWISQIQRGSVKSCGQDVSKGPRRDGLQLLGISPADSRLEPYWTLAEEFDVPVPPQVLGSGPPNSAYEARYKLPESRMALNDPLLLEEVLLRHKRLQVLLMHAGWPFLESTVALLYPPIPTSIWTSVRCKQPPAVLLKPLARARRKRCRRRLANISDLVVPGERGIFPSGGSVSLQHKRGGALHAIAEGERGLTSQLTVTVVAALVGSSSPLICRVQCDSVQCGG